MIPTASINDTSSTPPHQRRSSQPPGAEWVLAASSVPTAASPRCRRRRRSAFDSGDGRVAGGGGHPPLSPAAMPPLGESGDRFVQGSHRTAGDGGGSRRALPRDRGGFSPERTLDDGERGRAEEASAAQPSDDDDDGSGSGGGGVCSDWASPPVLVAGGSYQRPQSARTAPRREDARLHQTLHQQRQSVLGEDAPASILSQSRQEGPSPETGTAARRSQLRAAPPPSPAATPSRSPWPPTSSAHSTAPATAAAAAAVAAAAVGGAWLPGSTPSASSILRQSVSSRRLQLEPPSPRSFRVNDSASLAPLAQAPPIGEVPPRLLLQVPLAPPAPAAVRTVAAAAAGGSSSSSRPQVHRLPSLSEQREALASSSASSGSSASGTDSAAGASGGLVPVAPRATTQATVAGGSSGGRSTAANRGGGGATGPGGGRVNPFARSTPEPLRFHLAPLADSEGVPRLAREPAGTAAAAAALLTPQPPRAPDDSCTATAPAAAGGSSSSRHHDSWPVAAATGTVSGRGGSTARTTRTGSERHGDRRTGCHVM